MGRIRECALSICDRKFLNRTGQKEFCSDRCVNLGSYERTVGLTERQIKSWYRDAKKTGPIVPTRTPKIDYVAKANAQPRVGGKFVKANETVGEANELLVPGQVFTPGVKPEPSAEKVAAIKVHEESVKQDAKQKFDAAMDQAKLESQTPDWHEILAGAALAGVEGAGLAEQQEAAGTGSQSTSLDRLFELYSKLTPWVNVGGGYTRNSQRGRALLERLEVAILDAFEKEIPGAAQ